MDRSQPRSRAATSAALFAMLGQAGVRERSDRLELASAILGGERVESFTDLSLAELAALVEAMSAWRTVQSLRMFNGAMVAEAAAVTAMSDQIQALTSPVHLV